MYTKFLKLVLRARSDIPCVFQPTRRFYIFVGVARDVKQERRGGHCLKHEFGTFRVSLGLCAL